MLLVKSATHHKFPWLWSLESLDNRVPAVPPGEVIAHTRVICEAGSYTLDGHEFKLPEPSASYAWKAPEYLPNSRQQRTIVTVSNDCSLTAARRTRKAFKNGRILVLNMADRTNPGGSETVGGLKCVECMPSTNLACIINDGRERTVKSKHQLILRTLSRQQSKTFLSLGSSVESFFVSLIVQAWQSSVCFHVM